MYKGVFKMDEFSRTELLIQKDGLEKLRKSRVIVFGIGGVGGYVVEALTAVFSSLFLKI